MQIKGQTFKIINKECTCMLENVLQELLDLIVVAKANQNEMSVLKLEIANAKAEINELKLYIKNDVANVELEAAKNRIAELEASLSKAAENAAAIEKAIADLKAAMGVKEPEVPVEPEIPNEEEEEEEENEEN
jgi:hypothetical protein